MTNLTITVEDNPNLEDIQSAIANLVEYNHTHVEKENFQPFAIFIRDANNKILGALISKTHWGWLFISHLWVSESLRNQGYGRQLMLKAEAEAQNRGCHHIYLDTFSFQALDFYEKLGYQIFGVLEDFPPGHKRYFLQKRNLVD
jgi:ribosomal protein S18 acetylase RimI-like enzyme